MRHTDHSHILRNIKSKVFSGGIWVSFGFFVNAIAGLLIGILLSRILDTHDLGLYFLVFSVVTTGTVLGQLGMNKSIVRFISGALASGETGRARATGMRCLLIILTVCAVYGLVVFIPGILQSLNLLFPDISLSFISLLLLAIWTSVNTLRMFLAEFSRGTHNIKVAALTQRVLVNVFILCSLLMIWLLNIEVSLDNILVLATVSTFFVAMIALAYVVSWIYKQPHGIPDSFSTIYKSSAPLFISQGLLVLMTQFPIWVLGAYSASNNVAIYGIAMRTTLLVSMPLLIANNVIMPLVAALYKAGKKEKLVSLLSASVVVTSTISTILAFIFIAFGKSILDILYGNKYVDGYTPLIILTLGALLNVYAGSATVLLSMSGNEKWVLMNIAISALVSIFACLILVPEFNITGAAISSVIGLAIYNILLCAKARALTGISSYLSPAAVVMLVSIAGRNTNR